MIAKVRIAPVERWCPELLALFEPIWAANKEEMEPSSGSILSIETTSMRPGRFCSGREWRIIDLPEGIIATSTKTGRTVDPQKHEGWVCEHMVEID